MVTRWKWWEGVRVEWGYEVKMRYESEGVVFVAGLMPESVCLMQEGATQSRDCLSQTRRGAATQPSRAST